MPKRAYEQAHDLVNDAYDVEANVTLTPEGGWAIRNIPAPVRHYYETARAATGGLGQVNPLDITLRDNQADHRFSQLRTAITKAEQQATNRERFR